jgi:hypothetical protein
MADARQLEIDAHYQFKCNTGVKQYSVGLTHAWPDPETKPLADTAAHTLYDLITAAGHPCAANIMSTNYHFVGVEVAVGTDSGDDLGNYLVPLTGTDTSQPPPPNCCILVRKNTGSGGRKNRGRMFFPPHILTESSVDPSGNLTGAFLTIAQGLFNSWHTSLNTAGYIPLLKHSDAEDQSTIITSFGVQSLMATQRRRMR